MVLEGEGMTRSSLGECWLTGSAFGERRNGRERFRGGVDWPGSV